ncbi:MAG TPA: hypothetical protein QGH10_07645 [Armatimonadota bacterium]|nr:hypothetical protein [Armatimonadota bacterium]
MFNKVWLTCHTCKCEFSAEVVRLQQQPQRTCPNCGQMFDIRGMGMLTQALDQLIQASALVNFRFRGDQRLTEIARALRTAQTLLGPGQS